MCTVLLPPGDNPVAFNKYIKLCWGVRFSSCTSSEPSLLLKRLHCALTRYDSCCSEPKKSVLSVTAEMFVVNLCLCSYISHGKVLQISM